MRIGLFLAVLMWPAVVFANGISDGHGRAFMWGWGGMGFGPIFMILVLAAVVVLVVLLIRWLGGLGREAPGPHITPRGKSPIEILKERYARGEIDKEEFEERRRTLDD